ncbi:hypothetical protein O9Z70_13270 [Devosia sp. YIM 151766]|uniref:hypothetical protein n=1 Tax=Devosia sp. YIM 151766 TaxID=3017325 RepID=UPI00255C6706|nr:hypothetical protein [Devosia sp. YIM 151766]WIY52420.1 hypothetical protein O9Z70_13270 [Devosia sp. YIM 151766]
MNSLISASFVAVLASFGLPTGLRADQPAASCVYSSKTIDAELKFNHAGEASLSGVLGEVAFQCQMHLADIKDCRRCASIVNYILTFDRRECSTNPANIPLGQMSDPIPLHIFSSRAELGLLAGMPRVDCRTYSFDEDFELFEDG